MKTSKWLAPAMLGLALVAGCNEDAVQPSVARSYNQVQRLGNPLVSEVFLAKRSHPVHGSVGPDRKSTRLNSSHGSISYAVFCLKKKKERSSTLMTFSCTSTRHQRRCGSN